MLIPCCRRCFKLLGQLNSVKLALSYLPYLLVKYILKIDFHYLRIVEAYCYLYASVIATTKLLTNVQNCQSASVFIQIQRLLGRPIIFHSRRHSKFSFALPLHQILILHFDFLAQFSFLPSISFLFMPIFISILIVFSKIVNYSFLLSLPFSFSFLFLLHPFSFSFSLQFSLSHFCHNLQTTKLASQSQVELLKAVLADTSLNCCCEDVKGFKILHFKFNSFSTSILNYCLADEFDVSSKRAGARQCIFICKDSNLGSLIYSLHS